MKDHHALCSPTPAFGPGGCYPDCQFSPEPKIDDILRDDRQDSTCRHEQRAVLTISSSDGTSRVVASRKSGGRGQIGAVRVEVCLNPECRVLMLSREDVAALNSVTVEHDYTDAGTLKSEEATNAE